MRKSKRWSHSFLSMLVAISSLSLISPTPTGAAPSGYALHFDGVDDVVSVPGYGAIAPTTEITIEFWQKVDSVKDQYTLSLSPFTISNSLGVATPWGDGKVYSEFGDASGAMPPGRFSYTPPEALVGAWNHFAFVTSQAGNYMRIFRNGVLESAKVGMDPRAADLSNLLIGGYDLLGTYNYGGLLDELRIWNTARSEAAIQSTMNTSLNGDESGLLGYWRFDEGMGTTAADSAGNNDGTLTNGPVWVRVPEPTAFKLFCLAVGLLFVRQRHAK